MKIDYLKEYLSIVIDLIKNLELQICLKDRIDDCYYEQSSKDRFFSLADTSSFTRWIIAFLLGINLLFNIALATAFLGLPVWLVGGSILERINGRWMESDFHLYLLIAILGIPAALFIDNALIRVPYGWLKQFRQAANKLKSGNNHYRSELLAEKQMLEKEKSRLIELNIKWNSLTNPAIDDIGIIPWEQYGNIAKLISIYQNVSSGKCTTLEGEKGAFRLLDKDVEEGRLYINVSKLLDKPERAKKGQELLYRELTDINSRIDRIMKSNEQIVVSFCNADWNRNQINRKLEELLEESEFGKYIRECEEKMERYTERLKELTGGTFVLSEVDYSDLN